MGKVAKKAEPAKQFDRGLVSVGGYSFSRSESHSDFTPPGGSPQVGVVVENRYRARTAGVPVTRGVHLEVAVQSGHGAEDCLVEVEMREADLPNFLAAAITAIWLAERDGVIDPLFAEGHAVVEALYAALQKEVRDA